MTYKVTNTGREIPNVFATGGSGGASGGGGAGGMVLYSTGCWGPPPVAALVDARGRMPGTHCGYCGRMRRAGVVESCIGCGAPPQ